MSVSFPTYREVTEEERTAYEKVKQCEVKVEEFDETIKQIKKPSQAVAALLNRHNDQEFTGKLYQYAIAMTNHHTAMALFCKTKRDADIACKRKATRKASIALLKLFKRRKAPRDLARYLISRYLWPTQQEDLWFGQSLLQ